jgi:hypothetical protein
MPKIMVAKAAGIERAELHFIEFFIGTGSCPSGFDTLQQNKGSMKARCSGESPFTPSECKRLIANEEIAFINPRSRAIEVRTR